MLIFDNFYINIYSFATKISQNMAVIGRNM